MRLTCHCMVRRSSRGFRCPLIWTAQRSHDGGHLGFIVRSAKWLTSDRLFYHSRPDPSASGSRLAITWMCLTPLESGHAHLKLAVDATNGLWQGHLTPGYNWS